MWLTVSEKAAAVDVFDASVQSFTRRIIIINIISSARSVESSLSNQANQNWYQNIIITKSLFLLREFIEEFVFLSYDRARERKLDEFGN